MSSSNKKTSAADELQKQFPHLSLAEVYTVLERHGFDREAAANELRSTFAPSAGDHGVMYEMPPSAGGGSGGGIEPMLRELFERQRAGATAPGEGEGQGFFGSGRRLGHTDAPSPSIPAAVRQQRTVTVAVYANEIRVDGGDGGTAAAVIPSNSPEAKEFMAALSTGSVPRSLEALFPNCDLAVELQDRMDREYKPSPPTFRAFNNEGRRLGADPAVSSDSPSAGDAGLSYDPARTVTVDEGSDATVIRVVNTKGAQTEVKVNPATHTVEDLYALAHKTEPERDRFILEVRDMPPRKLGPETRTQTIEAAKLKRTVVVMRPL